MGKFLAIHTLKSAVTIEEATPIAKAAKAKSTLDAYWVGSWCQLNNEGKITRILCEWDAKDAQSIEKILKAIPGLPIDGVYPLAKVEGESYR